MILSVEHLTRHYGGVKAVDDVSFAVRRGSITALIGPNGAGKTTALNVISGITPPTGGRVRFADEEVSRLRPDEICRRGMSRTFQTPQIFPSMSLIENVVVGTIAEARPGLFGIALGLPAVRRQERRSHEAAAGWLKLVNLQDIADEPIAKLPFGKLRLAEIARALASKPQLLLMDEPASGLSRAETQELRTVLLRIRDEGITILLVEHNMPLVMSIADEVFVLDKGRLLASGTPGEVKANPVVQKAYLGAMA
jgi:branched-chain amino acid transport system ATP-binding protein